MDYSDEESGTQSHWKRPAKREESQGSPATSFGKGSERKHFQGFLTALARDKGTIVGELDQLNLVSNEEILLLFSQILHNQNKNYSESESYHTR